VGNFNIKNVEFCRQALLQKMTRPLPVLALYPKNSTDTSLYVQVIDNATVIAIRYVSSVVTNASVDFVGKSVEDVVQEINQLNLPVRAATIHNSLYLNRGDIVSTGTGYVGLPDSFTAYDRVDQSGVILRAKKLAVRHKSNSKIRTLAPYAESASLPWYPRITQGSFSQKYNNKLYHFYIPEFDNQSWSSKYGKPFKDLYGVKPVLKDENVYQLPRFPVYWDGQNITLYNGEVPISASAIEDIDVNNGLLYTKPGVFLQDGFSVDYSYLEKSYVYKDINVNGHFSQNPLILDKYVVIYILPAKSNQGIRKRSVFHTIGDSIDQAVDSIQLDDPSTPIAIIGAYNIQQLFSSDKVSILDTRGKGGGLKLTDGPRSPVHDMDSSLEPEGTPIEDLYQESYRYWDIGNYDGEAYPGAAAVAVDLPIDLQEVLSISDIKAKTSKFMAAGVYPSIKYTKRDLPSVTGMSAQASCAYNLDLSCVNTALVSQSKIYESIPASFTGGGWLYESYDNPTSIISGDWDSFQPTFDISSIDPATIEVNTTTGVVMPYLKSTSWAGVSWEEREVVYNAGALEEPVTYTPWKEVRYYDVKTAATGQLVKTYLSLDPESVVKQYRHININSPILTGNLPQLLEDSIVDIVDNTLALQVGLSDSSDYETPLARRYTNVLDKAETTTANDFTLIDSLYKHLFKMGNTPLEDRYYDRLYQIGEDFINGGTYTDGHYLKPYIQNIDSYVTVATDQSYAIFNFNDPLKALNGYLNMRTRKGQWSGACDAGAQASTGLAYDLMQSTLVSGPFERGIPIYWTYFPVNIPEGFTQDLLSGFLLEDPFDTVGTLSDVVTEHNADATFNFSLPAMMSTCVANSGELVTDVNAQSVWTEAYDLTVQSTVNNIDTAINKERTLSGLPTTTHWFVGHNRLGTYLGNTLFNMVEAYGYVSEYNVSRESIADVRVPAGASANDLNYMFSGIETVLEAGYDAVYHNLLRGGVVEPDIALTLYGYGWYLNNWKNNYGIRAKTYSTDNRDKFEKLFQNGLRQLVKNQITPKGELLEANTVYGEIGPFPASTASKILYPLAEAIRFDYSNWAGVAEGVVNTLVNTYSNDGLYYQNPYRQTTQPGKENDVLAGLIEMYKSVAQTSRFTNWEPMSDELTTLRGAEFLPPFDSYETAPVGDWEGTVNPLAFWKYYNSGDVETAANRLKGAGINTIEVPLDFIYWRENSGEFHSKLSHLLSACYENRVRAIPVLMEGGTTAVLSGQEADYVNTFGHTGGRYYYDPISDAGFISGEFSGEDYVTDLVNTYDADPTILAWSIASKPVNTATALVNYNTLAWNIKQLTTTPVIYNLDTNISKVEWYGLYDQDGDVVPEPGDLRIGAVTIETDDIYNLVSPLYNPNYDFIGMQPNNVFSYYLDNLSGLITKPTILSKYGDGAYGDYSVSIPRATSRNIPFTLSDFFVSSGEYPGNLYLDGRSRNTKQLLALNTAAVDDGVTPTGQIDQVTTFEGRYLYPTGFVPASNAGTILRDLNAWNSRTLFSATTVDDTFTQVDILSTVQAGLDTLNYVYVWTPDNYFVPQNLTVQECNTLNYYSSTWNTVDVFDSSATQWTLNGDTDYDRYNVFLGNWGNFLLSICIRLNING
jgi:hypothetical protein